MSATPPETPPSEWRLPKLRIDVDGDWFDDDVEITHPGILANLRGNLRKDAGGHFIQTRVRIPVEVADAPFVVRRVEHRDQLCCQLVLAPRSGPTEAVRATVHDRIRSRLRLSADVLCVDQLPAGPTIVDERDWR